MDAPDELPVRTVTEARAWLDACCHGGPGGERFVVAGLRFIGQFPDDERLAAAVLMNSVCIDLSAPVVEEYQRAFAWFLASWPDSNLLRQVAIPTEDPDAMRAVLEGMSRPTDDYRRAVEELAGQVRAGRMPLAVLAAAVRISYTEALIDRAAGPLVAMSPGSDENQPGLDAARDALDRDVVADLAALHVVAELIDDQRELAPIIDVSHRSVAVSESVARDVTLGVDALARQRAGTWMPPANGNPGYFAPVTDEERERVTRCSAQLQHRLAVHRTIPDPAAVTVFGERDYDTDLAAWDRPVQLAHDRDQPLWGDDVVTRLLAREAGIPAHAYPVSSGREPRKRSARAPSASRPPQCPTRRTNAPAAPCRSGRRRSCVQASSPYLS